MLRYRALSKDTDSAGKDKHQHRMAITSISSIILASLTVLLLASIRSGLRIFSSHAHIHLYGSLFPQQEHKHIKALQTSKIQPEDGAGPATSMQLTAEVYSCTLQHDAGQVCFPACHVGIQPHWRLSSSGRGSSQHATLRGAPTVTHALGQQHPPRGRLHRNVCLLRCPLGFVLLESRPQRLQRVGNQVF